MIFSIKISKAQNLKDYFQCEFSSINNYEPGNLSVLHVALPIIMMQISKIKTLRP